MKKKTFKVIWNFAPKVPAPKMVTLKNGQQVAPGNHDFRPEGSPTERIFCPGCKEYFNSWAAVLWRHGMRKLKPTKKEMGNAKPTKKKVSRM